MSGGKGNNPKRVGERKSAGTYHHGDLRRVLIDSALELARVRGPAGFSLAEICRAAGVSPAAPYRHFASKEHLLAEAAKEGFALLEAGARDACTGPGDFEEILVSVARGYLGFARAHPGYLAVMFRNYSHHLFGDLPPPTNPHPDMLSDLPEPTNAMQAAVIESWRAGIDSFVAFSQGIAAAAKGTPVESRIAADGGANLASAFWAMLHGVAVLWSEEFFPAAWVTDDCSPAIEWIVRPWVRGVLERAGAPERLAARD